MELVRIYESFCDPTRLRLLNILAQGPLCVCHFQAVLREPQVKISKHLGYLRTRGLVQVERAGNWMIYELPAKPSIEFQANLACLQECVRDRLEFRRDLARLTKLAPTLAQTGPSCCGPGPSLAKGRENPLTRPSADSKRRLLVS